MTKESYFLARLVIGSRDEIEIEKSEYDNLLRARRVLSEFTSLDEKFFAICENYRDIEEFIFKSALEDAVFGKGSVPDLYGVGAQFGRRIGSFLSSVRLFFDVIGTHVYEISHDIKLKDGAKIKKSKCYDDNFNYRVMEEIRNHSQHRAFPVHLTTFSRKRDGELDDILFSLDFYLDIYQLFDDKFKKSVRNELEALPGKFNLKRGVRSYFEEICKIHKEVKAELDPFQLNAVNAIEDARLKWSSVFEDNFFTGVAACLLKDGKLVKEFKKIYISRQLDEYREHLHKRTQNIKSIVNYRYDM
ncbi:MAG: hypothetical protein LCH47_00410 [Proteobacteria bacterium]|nr:hypothetical protein [Pseudomonadota bacterium]